MGGGAFRSAVVITLILAAAAPLFGPAAERDAGLSADAVALSSTMAEPAGMDKTRSADDPTPTTYTVVSPAQMSYRLLENREVVFPPDFYPDFEPGLIVTDYPWGASSSFTPGLVSPYQTRLWVYNYSTGVFRRYSYNVSFGGGFTWPGLLTPVPGPNATYVFTAGPWGGEGGSYTYTGQNFSWPISNVIDFPRPTGVVPLSLLVPATEVGYSMNQGIWMERSWTLSGYDLIGLVSLSAYIGNPPYTTFLYSVNLSNPEYLDVGRAHDVPPVQEIPWDAPLSCCFLERATSNVLFNVRIHYVGDTYSFEYVFYDLANQTGLTFPAPSYNVQWHERRGDILYALLGVFSPTRPSERTYSLVRVDLARARDFGNLTADAITEVWRKSFWKGYTNYYPVVEVRNDTLVVVEGSLGYEPQWGPLLDSVSTFGLLNGTLQSQEVLGLNLSTISRLGDVSYPRLPVRTLFGSYILDLDGRRAVQLNMTDIQAFVDQRIGRVSCMYCYRNFYVTDYGPSKIRLFGLGFGGSNFSKGSFTALEINIGSPPPNEPPMAVFTSTPTAYVGTPVLFNASGSEDVDGVIRSYRWDFGDGASGNGREVEHTFFSTGPRTATLVITSNGGLQGSASKMIDVHTLVSHDNPAGFRLPVPEDWTVHTQLVDADLLLDGPMYNGTASWVQVISQGDPAATEDVRYLEAVESTVVQKIRMQFPDATIDGGSSRTTVSGHIADVFLVRYDLGRVAEKIAIVVSSEHERWWVLEFVIDSAIFRAMDPLFNRMVSGFQITMPTPAETFAAAIGILAACGFGDLALAILLTLWSLRKRRPPASTGGAIAVRTPQRCPKCNTPSVLGALFCWNCGETFPLDSQKH